MLIIKCTGCQAKIRLKEQFAGKRIKCPKCQASIQVPAISEELVTLELVQEPAATQPRDVNLSQPEPQNPAPIVNQPAETFTTQPSFHVDVHLPATTPRRRQKSSVGIWLPICLVLIAGLVGMWYFMPRPSAPEIIVKDLPTQTIEEGKLLRLLIPIQSAGPGQQSSVEIVKGPSGSAIDPATREFTWTPSEVDGPGTFDVAVKAQSGCDILEGRFQIIVTESDLPPAFETIERVTAKPDEPLKVNVTAKDPDQPGVAVTYTLISTNELASAAKIDAQSGTLTWAPSELFAGEAVSFTVRATEKSVAALSSDTSVIIEVCRFDNAVRQFTVDLKKQQLEVAASEQSDDGVKLPFKGTITQLTVNQQPVTVVLYETEEQRQADVDKIDQNGSKAFDQPWKNPKALSVFAKDRLLVATMATDTSVLDQISLILDRPVAILRTYEPPPTTTRKTSAIIQALMPLYEERAKKRVAMYYQLLEVYSAAARPDLAFSALLQLSDLLEREDRAGEAIQALAVAIQKYPEEGQYVPRMLDGLEGLASNEDGSDQTLAEFHTTFLPKIPKARGDSPSEHCIAMYNRAVLIFQNVGQTQLAQNYAAAAQQMKSQLPK